MVLRARQHEKLAYRTLLLEYFDHGASWRSAPKPRLLDRVYRMPQGFDIAIDESEPLFDAANVARCGRDLFYLVSDSRVLGGGFHSVTLDVRRRGALESYC